MIVSFIHLSKQSASLTSRTAPQEEASCKPSQSYISSVNSSKSENERERDISRLPNTIPGSSSERIHKIELITFIPLFPKPSLRHEIFDVLPRWCVMSGRIPINSNSNLWSPSAWLPHAPNPTLNMEEGRTYTTRDKIPANHVPAGIRDASGCFWCGRIEPHCLVDDGVEVFEGVYCGTLDFCFGGEGGANFGDQSLEFGGVREEVEDYCLGGKLLFQC